MAGAVYPLFVDLRGVPVLVVGGGAVAARKVIGLVETGAHPTVVAREAALDLEELAAQHRIRLELREYAGGEAAAYRLVFAATDDSAVNRRVAADASDAGAWVNVADDPEASTAVVPGQVRADPVVAAVTTGACAPLLSRRLRERMGTVVTPGVGRAAHRLGELRAEVRARWPNEEDRRRRFWFLLITDEFLDSAIAGDDRDVEQRILRCLSQS